MYTVGQTEAHFLKFLPEMSDVVVQGCIISVSTSTQGPGKYIAIESSIGILWAEGHGGLVLIDSEFGLLFPPPYSPAALPVPWLRVGLRKRLQCGVH